MLDVVSVLLPTVKSTPSGIMYVLPLSVYLPAPMGKALQLIPKTYVLLSTTTLNNKLRESRVRVNAKKHQLKLSIEHSNQRKSPEAC